MPRDSQTGLLVSTKRLRAARRRVSYHEAGHAVTARTLGVEVADISMVPGGDAAAYVTTPSCAIVARSRNAGPVELAAAFETDLKISLAGQAAEKVAGYPARDEDPNDGDWVTIVGAATALACLQSGLSVDDAPKKIDSGDPLDAPVSANIRRAMAEVVELVRKHYPPIVRVAFALQRQDHLSAADLDRLIAGKVLY